MHVVATAGHVDHGKSTLVRCLTGTDPDRLAEEKARGLTIDLGFAGCSLPSGRGIAFVDVPGHVRFLKNMLAGVGAVDACLFVVDAGEGWKPQSEEHLRILELLGIDRGVVAVTKVGAVDGQTVAITRLDVEDHVAGTFLASADVVEVDAPTGVGLDDLRSALDRLLAGTPTARDRARPRLWIDRTFAARGSGTVVTGTLTGGALAVGMELEVQPAGRRVRVRGLQSLGRDHDRLPPGTRAAVNLAGIGHGETARGDALVEPDRWHLTRTVDASLEVLDQLAHKVSRRGAYLAYIGSGEHPVRLRVLGPDAIAPGSRGLVRLHLPAPLPLLPGDRYVLRESGRAETVGGGEVLDVAPVLPAARARPDRSVDRVVAERGWVEVDELERLTGIRRPADLGRWVVDKEAVVAATDRLRAAVEAAGPAGVDTATLDDRERAVLDGLDGVIVTGGTARPATTADPLLDHPYLAALLAQPFSPPPPDGVDRGQLRRLVQQGLVVEHDGVHFAAAAVVEASDRVARLLAAGPDGITIGQVREALGTTRKWAVPLLAHLDATGVTRRRGDLRIAGPRLPVPGDT
jgi:selenocysteine-specific elongation factor